MMLLSGGIFTLAVAVLAAQGPRSGGGKAKSKAARSPAGPAAAKTVTRSAAPSVARRHVVPAPRRADPGSTTQSRAPAPPEEQGADRAASSAGAGMGTSAQTADNDAAAAGASTKPAKTKVYTFGAMDVEGKLKTPQLLYFLNRVKLELEMSAPDHRSFMKELDRTAEDPNL